jgi:para-nitrobenzyl esterase
MTRIRINLCLAILALFTFSTCEKDTNSDTDDGRYVEDLFDDFDITTAVQFGQATTLGGNEKDLFMDIYEPAGDELAERPVIILAFGGGFVFGERGDLDFLCRTYTRKGYVTATIDYRLIDGFVTDSTGVAEAVLMAVSDMRAAVRFFREDAATANNYRIDPDRIFVGGISAGALTAMHTAALDADDDIPGFLEPLLEKHGGFTGNSSTNTEYSSSVQGVLSFSGALFRTQWIDSKTPPVYFVHEELDEVVPCGYGDSIAFFFESFIYGACAMTVAAEAAGVPYEFYFLPGSDAHVGYFDQTNTSPIIEGSAAFLKDLIE